MASPTKLVTLQETRLSGQGGAAGIEAACLLHRRWTFVSRVPYHRAPPRFVPMACSGGTVNGTVMAVFLRRGLHLLVARALALGRQ